MKHNHTQILVVKSKLAPVVEIDTEASAAYIRFKRAKIAKTLRHSSKWPIVTLDFDSRGDMIGVEVIGVKKFNLSYLLKQVPLKAPSHAIARASYISAE